MAVLDKHAPPRCTSATVSQAFSGLHPSPSSVASLFCTHHPRDSTGPDAVTVAAVTAVMHLGGLTRHVWGQGPVVVAQYLAVCEAAMSSAALLCPGGVSVALLALFTGPLALLFLALRQVPARIKEGDITYEAAPLPSISEMLDKMKKGSGILGKLVIAHAYWTSSREFGSWAGAPKDAL